MLARAGLVATLALASLLSWSTPAWACSCAMQTETEYASEAAIVFTGVATGVTLPARGPMFGDPVEVHFRVESIFKGDPPAAFTISTASDGATCGYGFEIGRRYTVFTYELESKHWTGLCSGNVPGEITAATYGLPVGRAPSASTPGLPPTASPQGGTLPGDTPQGNVAILTVVGGLALVAAVMILSRLRRPMSG